MKVLKRIGKIAGIVFIVAVVALTIYIMINGLGLIDEFDFGAGAYYYADIPGFSKFVDVEHFKTEFPMWLHIVLFLGWGAIMFKFWIWLDKKWK